MGDTPHGIGAGRAWLKRLAALAALGGAAALAALGASALVSPGTPPPRVRPQGGLELPVELAGGKRLTVWWNGFPAAVRQRATPSKGKSNVHPDDYVGPGRCAECHKRNHEAWSRHPHRWMNAKVGEDTVKGNFSGKASISYLGGKGTFRREGGKYIMRVARGKAARTYEITQTIGVRFFQYYVGKLIEGPEPAGHHFYAKDHVLPFGYWLDQAEWVPVVHVGPELPDGRRPDPYDPPAGGPHYADYAASCNYCHTTFPLGDLFGRRTHQMGEHAPAHLHWSMRGYVEQSHPEQLAPMLDLVAGRGGDAVQNPTAAWEASKHAVTFGISCEACHLGAKAHVESKGQVGPDFFPSSPHLLVEAGGKDIDRGRGHANVNWACGRCHTGTRPAFAAGMSTWNSVEYSDAVRGSCYSKLRCVDCHDPHQATGPRWMPTPDHDDMLCLKCHDRLKPAEQRARHTRHPAGSEGARCMNCHMPRINEGLQDVVRTHMITSPTRRDMIEANHPNACNLCHTDRPIDWTLRHLREWYGAEFSEAAIVSKYPNRAGPVAAGWLASDDPAVRLVAADALARAKNTKDLPRLLGALDDPHLLNRQFAARGLEGMLGLRLSDVGYRFYMTPEERRGPLARLRERVLRHSVP